MLQLASPFILIVNKIIFTDLPTGARQYQNLFISISNTQFIMIYCMVYSANYSCIMHRLICTNLKECCHSDLTNPHKVG